MLKVNKYIFFVFLVLVGFSISVFAAAGKDPDFALLEDATGPTRFRASIDDMRLTFPPRGGDLVRLELSSSALGSPILPDESPSHKESLKFAVRLRVDITEPPHLPPCFLNFSSSDPLREISETFRIRVLAKSMSALEPNSPFPQTWIMCLTPFKGERRIRLFMNEDDRFYLGTTEPLLPLDFRQTQTLETLAESIAHQYRVPPRCVEFYERSRTHHLYKDMMALSELYALDRPLSEVPRISFWILGEDVPLTDLPFIKSDDES